MALILEDSVDPQISAAYTRWQWISEKYSVFKACLGKKFLTDLKVNNVCEIFFRNIVNVEFKINLGIKVHTEVFDSGDLVRGEHLCYSGKIFLRSFWSLLLLLMQMLIAGDTLALEININFVLSG
jgi:hypothetical protein